jgi:hypothetical protein
MAQIETPEPMLTRRDIPDFIRQEFGAKLPLSSVNKLSMSKRGPKAAAFYGRRELYARPTVRQWFMSLLTDKPGRIGLTDPAQHKPDTLQSQPKIPRQGQKGQRNRKKPDETSGY